MMLNGRGYLRSVSGVAGAARPCNFSGCDGTMKGYLHKYEHGHALAFRCEKCHGELIPGESEAIAQEPETGEEALA